jgi:RNA polymerase sigma-B factor
MTVAHATAIGHSDRFRAESRELLQAYRCRGDPAARDRLVELHMPLVRALARRYANRGERFEDLVQVGAIGLLQAIERFDLDRGRDLPRFAAPTIAGEIRHHLRDRAAVVRIPRRCLDSAAARSPVPLPTDDAVTGFGRAIASDAPYDSSDDRLMLVASLRRLGVRERRIMHLRFFAGLSQDEIAQQVGVSQVQVSRLIRASLEQMRRALSADQPAVESNSRSRIEA